MSMASQGLQHDKPWLVPGSLLLRQQGAYLVRCDFRPPSRWLLAVFGEWKFSSCHYFHWGPPSWLWDSVGGLVLFINGCLRCTFAITVMDYTITNIGKYVRDYCNSGMLSRSICSVSNNHNRRARTLGPCKMPNSWVVAPSCGGWLSMRKSQPESLSLALQMTT
jgi:hypothetical protein